MIDTKTTVRLTGASNADTPEVLTLKDQFAQMTALLTTTTSASTSHPTDGAARNKRARANKNGKLVLLCRRAYSRLPSV
jgi:hypothetical protein